MHDTTQINTTQHMKAKQLIKEIEAIVAKHGNLDVTLEHDGCGLDFIGFFDKRERMTCADAYHASTLPKLGSARAVTFAVGPGPRPDVFYPLRAALVRDTFGKEKGKIAALV